MRILVISDTHITNAHQDFAKTINKEIEKSDYCIHAGDFTTYPVYKKLSKKIKTYAVAGNMDDQQITEKLPAKEIFELNNFTFALTHGKGTAQTLNQFIQYQFHQQYHKINIFIFGHSHQAVNCKIDHKIYFNPGSVGDTITTPERTYGIIEIKDGEIKRRIEKIG